MTIRYLNQIHWQTIMYYAVKKGLITYSHTASGYDTYTAVSKNLFQSARYKDSRFKSVERPKEACQ